MSSIAMRPCWNDRLSKARTKAAKGAVRLLAPRRWTIKYNSRIPSVPRITLGRRQATPLLPKSRMEPAMISLASGECSEVGSSPESGRAGPVFEPERSQETRDGEQPGDCAVRARESEGPRPEGGGGGRRRGRRG